LPLVLVDDRERDLGLAGLDDHKARAADDPRPVRFLNDGNQADMIDKIDIHEIIYFPLRKATTHGKEAPMQRLGAGTVDGGEELVPVVRAQCADLHPASVTHRLEGGIFRCFRHGRPCPASTRYIGYERKVPPLPSLPSSVSSVTIRPNPPTFSPRPSA